MYWQSPAPVVEGNEGVEMTEGRKTINFGSVRADKTQNNSDWSVTDMLEDALEEVAGDYKDYNKAVLILLNTNEGQYTHRRFIVNMRHSEIVALLNILSFRLIEDMRTEEQS